MEDENSCQLFQNLLLLKWKKQSSNVSDHVGKQRKQKKLLNFDIK